MKQDPTEIKLEVTRKDLIRMRYSPEIIEKAENYRTHELAYFKELVVAENDDISPKINSIKRRRFRDTKDEEDWKKLTTKR